MFHVNVDSDFMIRPQDIVVRTRELPPDEQGRSTTEVTYARAAGVEEEHIEGYYDP